MNTLDYLLEQLKLTSSIFCQLTLNGRWGLAKPRHHQGAPFHLVLSGTAWLRLPAARQLIALKPDDMVMIPAGYYHELLSDPDAHPVDFTQLLAGHGQPAADPDAHFQSARIILGEPGADQTNVVTGIFNFDQALRNPLVNALPDYLHLGAADNPWLPPTLGLLVSELDAPLPGMRTIAVRLADILFVQGIRACLSRGEIFKAGWLNGLTDPQIAKSLALIHQSPDQHWSIALLGQAVGMSRSRFAARFKTLLGQSPMRYLTEWRMYQAAEQLRASTIRLSQLAEQSGYESDVAFSKAFKKWSGCTPRAFRAGEQTKEHAPR
ncbi:AraC family transcriptional regulator [Shimwellia pseudoproteus]|uniref:AraC family transcriptional regulator n=1 Tax=Shimwellia pseudoproteus TaxID=570012 RepID=UPI0018EAE015|nr:AraC family transcriptional regulator [Shimwellia pseudoproteus]MBJ3813904.1 AraC family transcriptional regulator [Shimwellia pseudoproteus]